MDKFNAVSVPWIQVTDVRLLPDKAGNAMASVAAAGYTISFRESRGFEDGWQQKFEEFMSQTHIMVTKATKKGTAEIDLKPAIYDYKVEEYHIYLLVNASSEGNIKPTLVMDAFAVYCEVELAENALMITREETYGSKVYKDGNMKFIPLAEFGDWME